jgi:fatty acid amide hydrolase
MEGEPLSDSYNTLKKYTDFPTALRPPVRWLLQNVLGEKRRAAIFGLVPNGGSNVRSYWEAVAEMKDFDRAYQQYFRDEQLDAVLMPTLPITAPPHGQAPELIPMLTYTFLANLLHWPAGVVPVTLVRDDEQHYDISSLPEYQRDGLAKLVQKATKGSAGSPVGVQVMTPMWHDENCLHIMADIERGVKFTARPTICADTI